jgi:putative phosphonate metabolism protein
MSNWEVDLENNCYWTILRNARGMNPIIPMTARFAIYYAPHPTHPLARLASRWLGRDAAEAGTLPGPPPLYLPQVLEHDKWLSLTSSPRRYGFHATLKPPFRIAADADARATISRLETQLDHFSRARSALPLSLQVSEIDQFIALVPTIADDEIVALASDVVREFDAFRRPPDAAELQRRRAAGLTARQEEHLHAWGYPYVHDQFRFHMTLTTRIPDAVERDEHRAALTALFHDALEQPLSIDALVLFEQSSQGDPFCWRARYPFSRIDSLASATTA